MADGDRRFILHFDWTLFILVLALAGIGLVSVISASYAGAHRTWDPLVIRQLIWIAFGTVAMLIAVLVDYRALQAYAYPFYVMVIGLLIAVMISGHATGGSRRWINLGVFHLEPSELAKLAVVLITLTLVFVGGLNLRTMLVLAMAAMLAAPLSWHYLKPYQRQRLVSFINPQADPLGSGYHIIQSEIAIGAGGPFGKGFLKGTQARLNFLPEQSTDFIFAVFAEEFGLAGALLMLALYASVIARGAWIARHARDRFGALLAVGLTAIVFW